MFSESDTAAAGSRAGQQTAQLVRRISRVHREEVEREEQSKPGSAQQVPDI